MFKLLALAIVAALPHPTNPPSPYSVQGQPHYAIDGGPARGLIHGADPFGDGSRVTLLGWYDANGTVRFYEAENPQLYNARAGHRPIGTPLAGVTRDPDGALNGGLAIGAIKPATGETMETNRAVGGEVYKDATEEARRKCGPDEPCDDDEDEEPADTIKLTADQAAVALFAVLAFVVVLGVILRRR